MSDNADLNGGDNAQAVASAELKSFIERIERLEEDKQAVLEDIREVKLEAKIRGYNTKIISRVLKLRKMDAYKRAEEDAITELYLHALGML